MLLSCELFFSLGLFLAFSGCRRSLTSLSVWDSHPVLPETRGRPKVLFPELYSADDLVSPGGFIGHYYLFGHMWTNKTMRQVILDLNHTFFVKPTLLFINFSSRICKNYFRLFKQFKENYCFNL